MPSLPINIVGANVFGRYPKISVEATYNMIISDKWLIPYSGYEKLATIDDAGTGRGIFNSSKLGKLIIVINDIVYTYDKAGYFNEVGKLHTHTGDVFIAENKSQQIAICDKKNIYLYDYGAGTFAQINTGFKPGYVIYQDGYFLSPDLDRSEWRLSTLNNGASWPTILTGEFQTDADNPVAVVKVPGKGNRVLVMGSIVTELWGNVGSRLFPYQRTSGFNIDYGCANPASIGTGEGFVAWVGVNARSGAAIMYSTGGVPEQISTDGINFKLDQLTDPTDCAGFIFKQDGHVFYQITFRTDNVTYVYDFNTQKFFTMTDKNMDFHIAKDVAYFDNDFHFISFTDGNIYKMSSDLMTYDGEEIPRIRVCTTLRTQDGNPFIANRLAFIIEQGTNEEISRVDLSISIDGGEDFSSYTPLTLNSLGTYRNQAEAWGLGYCNEFTAQFRFWSKGRFVVNNGVLDIYK